MEIEADDGNRRRSNVGQHNVFLLFSALMLNICPRRWYSPPPPLPTTSAETANSCYHKGIKMRVCIKLCWEEEWADDILNILLSRTSTNDYFHYQSVHSSLEANVLCQNVCCIHIKLQILSYEQQMCVRLISFWLDHLINAAICTRKSRSHKHKMKNESVAVIWLSCFREWVGVSLLSSRN